MDRGSIDRWFADAASLVDLAARIRSSVMVADSFAFVAFCGMRFFCWWDFWM